MPSTPLPPMRSSSSSQSRIPRPVQPAKPVQPSKPVKPAKLVPPTPTDPTEIRYLWRSVMNAARNPSSRKPKPPSRLPVKASDSGIGSSGSRTPAGSAAGSTTGSVSASRPVRAKTTDTDFDAQVLAPRGITIDPDSLPVLKPWFHFATPEPPSNSLSDFYRGLPGLHDTTVWLEGHDAFVEEVLREYQAMREQEENEAEHAAYAVEALLKREPRSPHLNADARPWKCERKIEFTIKLERLWEAPPLLSPPANTTTPARPFNFHIRPDCSYWISLQAFNPHYRALVKSFAFVRQSRILCPYLSVEFKKHEKTAPQAVSQVAVAAALALYNRYKLKLKRVRAAGATWTPEHVAPLRHYGLVVAGRAYQFWCAVPVLDAQRGHAWGGCRVFLLFESECSERENVRHFIDWVNEIHRWGLTVHGPDCEDDVRHCVQQAGGGARTSLDAVADVAGAGAGAGAPPTA